MEDMQMKSFLQQLYQMSDNQTTDVSMFVIGEHLGLDKTEAGSVAEDLIIDGFAELKTLAGGISITAKGLEALGKGGGKGTDELASRAHVLGSEEVLGDEDQQAVARLIDEVKREIFSSIQKYDELEEFVVDIKTVETQLLSPRPKTSIIKEVLRSIAHQLQQQDDQHCARKINVMIGGK